MALHKETFDYVREKKNINTNRLGWEKTNRSEAFVTDKS